MTPAERRALQRIVRQANAATPDLQTAILRAFQLLREGVSEAALVRALQAQDVSRALELLVGTDRINRALNAASGELQREVGHAIRRTAPLLPNAAARAVVVGFNQLDPRIIRAIQTLDSTSLRSLVPPVREAVRQAVTEGIRQGINPRTMARELTETIGLAPNQERAVRNYRAALEAGDMAKARGYALRDGRFNHRTPPTPAIIEKMVARYRQRMITFHAETHARTAAIEAQKLGQRLAWQEAQRAGTLSGSVVRRWVTNIDGRERDEHRTMHGQTAPLDGTYSNGQSYPGEGEYNCRCSEAIGVARPTP